MSRTKTITRLDLTRAVQRKLGLSSVESRHLIEQVLDEIGGCVARGEMVKLWGFGSFAMRRKGQRYRPHPATREELPIAPRSVMVFKPSDVKQKINATLLPPDL